MAQLISFWVGRVIFGCMLLLLFLVAAPYGTVEPWWQSVFNSIVFALSALSVVESYLSGHFHIKRFKLLLPIFALVGFSFVQSLAISARQFDLGGQSVTSLRTISADPFETSRFALRLLALALTGAMLLRYTSSKKRLRLLVHAVVGVGLLSAIFGIARQTLQHGSGFVLPSLEGPRTYAQFVSKNYFAYLMEMSLGLLAGIIFGRGIKIRHLPIYLSALLVLWASLIMADSRGALLALVVQIVFLTIFLKLVHPDLAESNSKSSLRALKLLKSQAIRCALMSVLSVALVISIFWIGGRPLILDLAKAPTDFSSEGSQNGWNVSRRDIWKASWRLFTAHPIVGSGFGAYWIAVTKYHDASGDYTPQQAHNDYLELLASGGVVGFILVAWFGIAFVRFARDELRSLEPFRRSACYGALVGLAGVAVHSFVDFGLHATINSLVFAVLVVIAIVPLPTTRFTTSPHR